ncbi:AGAP011212-PA-like protein [Anopheles sinensis]|uniref:AGAP011212-PA-like protein n=1 Tax=Anopheles sinensis TaxID=74873 RepID=A0A084W3J8_ANOSI|nr:AGAP011212-PA-like protein [Anopheles sinensis]
MSVVLDDFDEENHALVIEALQMADELVAITAKEELQHARSIILKDIEADIELFSKTIASYHESLNRLALLEHGMLHGLNKTSAAPPAITKQLDQLEGKMEILREVIRENITFLPPSTISKETFASIGSHREQLAAIEQEVERLGTLIDGNQARDVATSMTFIQRKTNKLLQDLDSFLKLNALQKQTIMGFSNKIFNGNPK